MKFRLSCLAFLIAAVFGSACVGPSGSGATESGATIAGAPVGFAPPQRTFQTDALVFNGDGAWTTEVSSVESILSSNGASYQEVTSAQLEAMTVDQLASFGVFIMPGGSGGTEAASLSAAAHARLREAVNERGVGYVGFCAGAWVAVAPAPAPGQDVSYGFGIVNGPVLDYYYLSNQNVDIAMTLESFPDGSTEDLLWYGGPITPNTPGGVIARYPDGNPAITEVWAGNGLVMLSGPHPTATASTLAALGVSSTDGTHLDLVWKLVDAAMHGQPLQAF